ncbi:MAG: YbjQ family protein [Candidatus Obscuribacterales bacterium]|nr:YbjQ family protein [Candidatus Obscuribacterales bacterium]
MQKYLLGMICVTLLAANPWGYAKDAEDAAEEESLLVTAMTAPPDVIVSTTNQIDGYRVKQYKGVVRGISVRQPTVGQGLSANLERMAGGRISAYVAMCEKGRQQAYSICLARAKAMGANGLIGVQYDSTAFNHGDNVITEDVCYGTAVVIEKTP